MDVPPYAPLDQAQKSLARWLYIFHGLSLIFSLGMLSFIPLIVNYIKRGDAAGTIVATHHSWQIRSFWWYFGWVAFGFVPFFTFVLMPLAWLIWALAWIWKAYRLIKGLIYLNEDRPMPGGAG
ncbi:hypothetical protein D9O50_05180 [Oxalobacteraceae bacterium CAVE-383]|nr:hypothetical protein D9O50_05180 [Oxalobacteraceae bacterium CAVE-383]